MKSILTKVTTALLLSLTLTLTVTAQNFKYKVGDKVEANVFGTWYKGTIANVETDGTFKILVDGRDPNASGSVLYKEPGDLRQRQVEGVQKNTQTAESTNDAPCDWSEWGVMPKKEFMDAVVETSGRFERTTKDLLCHIRSRKVNFQLTAQEEAAVNKLRNSPELLQALRDNYKGEKKIDYGKASSIKTGRYACGGRTYQPDLFILSSNEYNTRDLKGKYTFSSATNKITWSAGTFAGGTMSGEYFPNINTITVYNVKGQILFNCNLADK